MALDPEVRREDNTARNLYLLALFEVNSMGSMVALLQSQLDDIDPEESPDSRSLITILMILAFTRLVTGLWDDAVKMSRGYGLSVSSTAEGGIKEAIDEAANLYSDTLVAAINKKREDPTYQIQFGDIREVASKVGGGSADNFYPTDTGLIGGSIFNGILGDNGLQTKDKIWRYGEAPRRTFYGHLQLDGLIFDDWQANSLVVLPRDYWLGTPWYHPNDHDGCRCVVVPYIPSLRNSVRASAEPEIETFSSTMWTT